MEFNSGGEAGLETQHGRVVAIGADEHACNLGYKGSFQRFPAMRRMREKHSSVNTQKRLLVPWRQS